MQNAIARTIHKTKRFPRLAGSTRLRHASGELPDRKVITRSPWCHIDTIHINGHPLLLEMTNYRGETLWATHKEFHIASSFNISLIVCWSVLDHITTLHMVRSDLRKRDTEV